MATIKGTSNPDTLHGTSGDDTIYGYAGDDVLIDNQGNDWLLGGDGNDTLSAGSGINDYWGGDGSDTVKVVTRIGAAFNDDLVHGFVQGTDKIDVSAWGISDFGQIQDLLFRGSHGEAAFNAFFYSRDHVMRIENISPDELKASDFIFGTSGPASQTGTLRDDTLFGSAGNNTLDGSAGDDLLMGGGGDDVLIGGTGLDNYDGGAGVDTVSYNYTNERVDIDLAKGRVTFGDGAREFLISIEAAVGSTSGDRLTGDSTANTLDGDRGNDVIKGGGGADVLIGGTGADLLSGNGGADTFSYAALDDSTSAASGRDTIKGFEAGDHIDFRDLETATGESFTFIGSSAFSHTAGELQVVTESGNTFVNLDADGNGSAEFSIQLNGIHALTQSDLLL